MTRRDDERRRDRRPLRQRVANQGMADLGYGYGSGDWGYRDYPGGMGWRQDRDRTAPSTNSDRGPQYGPHYGKGPRNYARSDDRLREEVIDRLTDHPELDATDLDVKVERQEAYLYGHVPNRDQKRLAAELAFDVPGVSDVFNSIRVGPPAGPEPQRP